MRGGKNRDKKIALQYISEHWDWRITEGKYLKVFSLQTNATRRTEKSSLSLVKCARFSPNSEDLLGLLLQFIEFTFAHTDKSLTIHINESPSRSRDKPTRSVDEMTDDGHYYLFTLYLKFQVCIANFCGLTNAQILHSWLPKSSPHFLAWSWQIADRTGASQRLRNEKRHPHPPYRSVPQWALFCLSASEQSQLANASAKQPHQVSQAVVWWLGWEWLRSETTQCDISVITRVFKVRQFKMHLVLCRLIYW